MKSDRPYAPIVVLVALWLVLGIFVWATFDQLPERVATHFGRGGHADAWMTRAGHVRFLIGFAVGLPIFLHIVLAVVRSFGASAYNLPHRAYWLAPERRESTIAYVQSSVAWFICVIVGFFAGAHYLVLNANTHQPPAMSMPLLLVVAGSFLVLLCAWIARLIFHFYRVPKTVA